MEKKEKSKIEWKRNKKGKEEYTHANERINR